MLNYDLKKDENISETLSITVFKTGREKVFCHLSRRCFFAAKNLDQLKRI